MGPIDKGQREVIAHFSVTKLILGWGIWLVFAVILFFWVRDVALPGFETSPDDPAARAVNSFGNFAHLGLILVTCVGLGLLLFWGFKATRNIIMHGTDAVWIEQGRLVCRGTQPLDIAIDDIRSAELASQFVSNWKTFSKYEVRYVSIVLKDGTLARLDLGPYREIEDAILAPITARIEKMRS